MTARMPPDAMALCRRPRAGGGFPVAAAGVLGSALLALGACAPVQDAVARETARAAIRPVVATRFPGMPLEPATDCIIDAASGSELRQLARSLAQPVADTATAALVAEIAARPDALSCLTTSGLAPFLR